MPLNNTTYTTKLNILCLLVIIATFNSCNYIVKNDKKKHKIEAAHQKNINVNIEEAQLLVEIAKTNADIITLSSLVKLHEDSLNVIAQSLEKKHMVISQDLANIAQEKLILIPDTTYKSEVNLQTVNKDNLVQHYLERVTILLENQIHVLDALGDRTIDNDFKALSIETKEKIKAHLSQTGQLLSEL